MRLYVLIGAPGSGKSTWASGLGAVVCSADDHFIEDGQYRFDPRLLGDAHAACFRKAVEACGARATNIVIDNTNTTAVEISPYVALGQAYGYEVVPVVFVARGQNIHGVPEERVREARDRIDGLLREWPRFWPAAISPYRV